MKNENKKWKVGKSVRMTFILIYTEHIKPSELKKRLKKITTKEYAWIVHNKDLIKGTNEPKKEHIHLYLKFNAPYPVNHLIKMIWKPEDKKNIDKYYRFFQEVRTSNNIKKYLIHLNDKSKFQYKPEEVVASFDYKEWITETKENDTEDYVKSQIEEFTMGNLNHVELKRKLNPLEYLTNDNIIQRASKVRIKYLSQLNRDISVWYITGDSGIGKSTFAKMICEKTYGKGNTYISSSNNDALGEYEGQKAIILDDLRGSTFAYNDLIKLIDNNTNTTVKSRYFNKYIEAETIIITSVFPPTALYDFEKMGPDTYEQLHRRIKKNNVWIDQKRNIRLTENNEILYNMKDKLIKFINENDKNNNKLDLDKSKDLLFNNYKKGGDKNEDTQ